MRLSYRDRERSNALDQPRTLIQIATGNGKTCTAVTFTYQLIKHANAHRLFGGNPPVLLEELNETLVT
jgi:UDP-N-acetylmuramoylalanine-D-glutamate ligase